MKTIDVKVERTICAVPGDVFDAWLDPKTPGTLWHGHDKLIFNPEVDGLWYLLTMGHRPQGTPHYGRFTKINRPRLIEHSWMSRNTLGEESMVTVTFQKRGEDTLVTVLHTGLKNGSMADAHEKGWNSILDGFSGIFGAGSQHRK